MVSMLTLTGGEVAALSDDIHSANVQAGWWTDRLTGESLIGKRNVGEVLMLCVSELAEAGVGWWDGLPDDKLPHRPMFEVELGDTVIRTLDLVGAYVPNLPELWNGAEEVLPLSHNLDPITDLFRITCVFSAAMEAHRKNTGEFGAVLVRALRMTIELADTHDCDLTGAIAEKRAFNLVRADHKIEARNAPGGKAY
jgi:hypothetical protein